MACSPHLQDCEPQNSRRNFFKHSLLTGAAIAGVSELWPQAAMADTIKTTPMWPASPIPAQVPVTDAIADLGDTRLWYWDTGGNGEVVIFMHAGSQSAAGWGYQQAAFASAGYRVIGYSRRGYFKSDLGDINNPGVASDDLDRLLQHLNIERAHLVAMAHGGYFALDYSLSHPAKVLSLTLASSMLGVRDDAYSIMQKRLRPPFFNDLPVDFKELGPSYRAGNPEGHDTWKTLAKAARPGGRVMPEIKNELSWKNLKSIKVPVLLMTGDADLYVPPSVLRLQASHFPAAETVIIKEAGHCSNWEQPQAFNTSVLQFIGKHTAT